MGVYHLAGLGKSIGAVTAAFSYLAARKALGDPSDPLFALSGEADEDPATRGAVEALVLFATEEIVNDTLLHEEYWLNQAGREEGAKHSGNSVQHALKPRLREEARPLARRELDKEGRPAGGLKPLELYWCTYERDGPVSTFERAAQVMRAASGGQGRVGKEFWVNLTGGSNIVNGALQLAASLTGAPARMYYLLSANPHCVRHTVPPNKLRTDEDHFWVDLPIVYVNFSPVHLKILDALEQFGALTLHDVQAMAEIDDRPTLIHSYLRPLSGQRLIVHERDAHGQDIYGLGDGWARARRYLAALRPEEGQPVAQSLSELARLRPEWFHHELLHFD